MSELVKRALEQIDKGLHLTTRPKDTMYLLKLVCLQQLGRNAEVAEILELLLKTKPDLPPPTGSSSRPSTSAPTKPPAPSSTIERAPGLRLHEHPEGPL
jgi:hypothetical protein